MRARAIVAASFAFTLGAMLGPAEHPLGSSIFMLAMLALAAYLWRGGRRGVPLVLGAGFFFAGLLASLLRLPQGASIEPGETALSGVVAEAPELGLDADALILDAAGARLRVRIPHAADAEAVRKPPCGGAQAGDRVTVAAHVRPLHSTRMPLLRSRRLAVRRGVALAAAASTSTVCVSAAQSEASSLRAQIASAISRNAPAGDAALLRALATGDRTGSPHADEERFLRAGMSYLFVLGGLHAGAILLLVFLGLRRLTRSPRIAALICAPLAVPLALLYGGTPTLARVSIVLLAVLAAQIWEKLDAWSALAIAVILVLAWDPAALGDVSFQLPFAAIAASLRTYPALARRFPKPAHPLLFGLALAIGTAPLAARMFDRVTLASLAANIFVLPLASFVAAPLALLGGLAGTLSDGIAAALLHLAAFALAPIQAIASWLADHRALALPTPTMLDCALFYAATISFSLGTPRARRAGIATVALLAALAIGGHFYVRPNGKLRAAFLPVAEGHAAVVELPAGATLAVTTAPPSAGFDLGERALANYLKLRRKTKLDALLVAGPDRGSVESARDLSHQLDVDQIWWTDRAAMERGRAGFDPGAQHILLNAAPFDREGVRIQLEGGALRLTLGEQSLLLTPDGGELAQETREKGLILVEIDGRTREVTPFRP